MNQQWQAYLFGVIGEALISIGQALVSAAQAFDSSGTYPGQQPTKAPSAIDAKPIA